MVETNVKGRIRSIVCIKLKSSHTCGIQSLFCTSLTAWPAKYMCHPEGFFKFWVSSVFIKSHSFFILGILTKLQTTKRLWKPLLWGEKKALRLLNFFNTLILDDVHRLIVQEDTVASSLFYITPGHRFVLEWLLSCMKQQNITWKGFFFGLIVQVHSLPSRVLKTK